MTALDQPCTAERPPHAAAPPAPEQATWAQVKLALFKLLAGLARR